MQRFTTLTSVAAALPESDVDTDIIFPARFLLLLDRKGLGQHVFHERRHAKDGTPFVLEASPWNHAEILVAGANFGCGSSREQAVWALVDFGIRCIIARSFGEIFFANCFKNGALPIVLDEDDHTAVMAEAQAGNAITVDLETQTVSFSGGRTIRFEIEPQRKRSLLLGLDEIGEILADDEPLITQFEERHWREKPWLNLNQHHHACFADVTKETT
jgi:3-isopropylmalate/(R)-2-methylmalate dehydratase small subunit